MEGKEKDSRTQKSEKTLLFKTKYVLMILFFSFVVYNSMKMSSALEGSNQKIDQLQQSLEEMRNELSSMKNYFKDYQGNKKSFLILSYTSLNDEFKYLTEQNHLLYVKQHGFDYVNPTKVVFPKIIAPLYCKLIILIFLHLSINNFSERQGIPYIKIS